jgi:phosphatidate cytidylyltransferase
MLKTRILTALILGCLLLAALFLLPPRGTVWVLWAVFTLGAWEWARFGALDRAPARMTYAGGIALLCWGAWVLCADPRLLLSLLAGACAWWAFAFLWVVFAPGRQRPLAALLCGLLVLVPSFVALGRLQVADSRFARGPEILLWLLLIVFAADIGAFFAGRSFGRHKLAPKVSPGKTWEGAVGGLATVAVVAAACALRLRVPVVSGIAFGCAVGLFSIVGDLTESMFKRAAGLKDSGALLPGHGGMLDRIDSVTAAAPLYALGLYHSGVLQ